MSGRFYWVFNTTTKGQPSVRHDTESAARAEAERLARKDPGQVFVVLEAKASYRLAPPPMPPVTVTEHRPPVRQRPPTTRWANWPYIDGMPF